MELRFEHLILTRFNMRVPGAGYKGEWPEGWLDYRFELFERFCLPSVKAQTCTDFRWLIFCDDATPPEHLERLEESMSNIELVLCPAPDVPEHQRLTRVGEQLAERRFQGGSATRIPAFVARETEFVVSTRLDNDDALHVQFVERVQEHLPKFVASPHEKWLHNFPNGYKLHFGERRLFASRMPNSPFLSLFERRGAQPLRGALSGNHSTFHTEFATGQDETLRAWLQLIHGGNVLNKVTARDIEMPLDDLGASFGLSLAELESVSQARVVPPS